MKHTIFETTKSALLLFALVVGAPPALADEKTADDAGKKEMTQKVGEAAETIKNYTVAQKDEAMKKARVALQELDERIKQMEDRLDKEWDQMERSPREAARVTLRKMHEQRNELAQWYGELQQSSASAWERVKKGFVDSYDALRASLSKAQKEF